MQGLAIRSPGGRLLVGNEPSLFTENLNKRPFLFNHGLADHPLFSLSRLAEAAEKMLANGGRDRFVVFNAKAFGAGSGFGEIAAHDQLAQTVRGLADGRTWLKLSSANEADPAYAEVLQQIVGDLSGLSGRDLASEITWSSLTIFLASPGVVTPYHIDHESNFLLQVQGSKDVFLFDQDDRDVLSEGEIERFYAGDEQAAHYRPDMETRGQSFHLSPGTAVHHPPLSPHWVRNGENVSVSVSIGFCMRSFDRRAKIYQMNDLLRHVGIRPTPPGRFPMRDRLKAAGLEFATKHGAVSREDILFSGIRQIKAPLRFASRIRGQKTSENSSKAAAASSRSDLAC
jgi:hypothetical protein